MIIDFQNIWNSSSHWFEQLTAPVKVIAGLVTIIGGCWTLKKFLREIPIWRKTELNKLRDINGGELLKLVKSNRFIPTMGQTDPPHVNKKIHASSNRFPLINHILKDLFDEEKSLDDKRYMILGGSGMGKSTFSVALFYKYIFKNRFKKSPYPIYIKSLWYPDVIQEINDLKVSVEQNAIIILDALDERSFDATNDLSVFIEQLEEATRNFLAVIITCRTQFFPDGKSEPDELTIRKKGGDVRTLRYEKIYISPFNEKESNKYLQREFGLNILKYFKAKKITNKCEDILLRPMILSFIGDLMKIDNIQNLTTFEIYSHIIDKWFDREIEVKPNEVSKEELFSFSKQLSLFMYNCSSMIISDSDYQSFLRNNGFKASPFSFSYRGRTLLNRNNDGDIKFSHKSFWEFFMAIIVFEKPGKSLLSQKSVNTNMSKLFFKDLCSLYMKGGKMRFVEFDTKRLVYVDSIFRKNSVINSYNQLRSLCSFCKSFEIGSQQLLMLLDYSINLIISLANTRVEINHNSHHNHFNPNIFQTNYVEEVTKSKLASIFSSIGNFSQSLIYSIQEYYESYDWNVIYHAFSKENLDEYDSIIAELSLVKNAKFSFYDTERFDINYSFFSNDMNRIRIIGSSSLFFYQIDELGNDNWTPYVVILLKDSDNLDELVDFINVFNSYELQSMIFLNVKYKSSVEISFNYVIDNTTKLWDKSKIRSILSNMISTCEKQKSMLLQ